MENTKESIQKHLDTKHAQNGYIDLAEAKNVSELFNIGIGDATIIVTEWCTNRLKAKKVSTKN